MNDDWEDVPAAAPSSGAGDWEDVPQQSQKSAYSYGPLSDLWEMRDRLANKISQALPEGIRPPVRQNQPLGHDFNLPVIGRPSAVGMVQGLARTAASGAALPGDVYAGRTDPLSEEGIQRSANLASLVPTGTLPFVGRRAAVGKPLESAAIEEKAGAGYDVLRDASRRTAIPTEEMEGIVGRVRQQTSAGPSPREAPEVYKTIEGMKTPSRPPTRQLADLNMKSGDLGDLIETRRVIMDKHVRNGEGAEINAGLRAVQAIDSELEGYGIPRNHIRELDKNYAIAKHAEALQAKVENAIREAHQAGSGGNVGNKIRQAIRPELKTGNVERLSPEEQQAMERVTSPGAGVQTLRMLSAFDPTRHKLLTMAHGMGGAGLAYGTGGASIPFQLAAGGTGWAARAMYDRIMRQRAMQAIEAMRGSAPASQAAGFRFPSTGSVPFSPYLGPGARGLAQQ